MTINKLHLNYVSSHQGYFLQTMTIPNHYIWLYQDKSILYMVKLTLVLSCAMNFKNYPHDTQVCNLKIESSEFVVPNIDNLVFCGFFLLSVYDGYFSICHMHCEWISLD